MMPVGFATELSLNQAECQLVQSNQDESNYGRQQMLNGQSIKMSVNRVSTIGGLVGTEIH
jgi:hypothetical protein